MSAGKTTSAPTWGRLSPSQMTGSAPAKSPARSRARSAARVLGRASGTSLVLLFAGPSVPSPSAIARRTVSVETPVVSAIPARLFPALRRRRIWRPSSSVSLERRLGPGFSGRRPSALSFSHARVQCRVVDGESGCDFELGRCARRHQGDRSETPADDVGVLPAGGHHSPDRHRAAVLVLEQ